MFENAAKLIRQNELSDDEVQRLLGAVGFTDWQTAHARLLEICPDEGCRKALSDCLPMLLAALSNAATPDGSLINFQRFVQSVEDRTKLFQYLASNPRAVEILIKLFVGSQFLTEILLRNTDYLNRLTNHKRLAEFKSQQQFYGEAYQFSAEVSGIDRKLDALRRYQHWELLRIGACDSFGLFDLKSVTVQLSLLADSLVQCCLALLASELDVVPDGFVVLAFGKLGGEELNYSSDIDLVFLAERDATRFWSLGQRLIKALMQSTAEGFLYRVDMRLRPWGRSGALVNSVDAHLGYLKKHGMHWEKQALLKARPIAGDISVGRSFLNRAEPLIYGAPQSVIRESIHEMKDRIEADLQRQGRKWGEVKSGEGSIRDIEFITQCLQLSYGGENREVRSFNTLDGLVRLADFGFLHGDEYRQLASGYVLLRTIEHSLQLMHHKQTHTLPEDKRELAYLARRLDFPDAAQFLTHYRQHCEAIRRIYERYIGGESDGEDVLQSSAERMPDHRYDMEPSYSQTFSDEEIVRHAVLLKKLSTDNLVEFEAAALKDGNWQLTLVGFNHLGELSMICGLLFVHGFNIVDGNVFTAEQISGQASRVKSPQSPGQPAAARNVDPRKFVTVFTVHQSSEVLSPDVWARYKQELVELLLQVRAGRQREAQGQLAKRVAGALRDITDSGTTLLPVEVEIDNDSSERSTVLHIRAEDTIGFLYELTNALALTGINIGRVIVSSRGKRVFDTLSVTDADGEKITDSNRQRELRAAVVLIKHFTHLLPRSPNPEAALLHFRDFLEQLFQQPHWLEELSSLQHFDVLDALARLLGVSNFLWEDFLRLQHANLFPVVKDVEALALDKSKKTLEAQLQAELASADGLDGQRTKLNAFKDREMFRADMRHIMGQITEFGRFAAELTDVAEVVVAAAYRICDDHPKRRYGVPRIRKDRTCPLTICALGKCGGRELGFASGIELMFIYEDNGNTSGPEVITATEYFQKLVEAFTQTIQARQEGIFQIDLRLRPYGNAGSLAVSLDAFRNYFAAEGAAWPYERQALVKLRPIAGDLELGKRIVSLRDELIYTGEPFDVAAMRAMREKQVTQLVQAGTLNAKLSPGALVDSEYLVQGLQITHGHRDKPLRETNTRAAMAALNDAGVLSTEDHTRLLEAYIFQRRLIDALRMVRGHAKDLTVPPADSEEFEFLARRLDYHADLPRLKSDLERYTQDVQALSRLIEPPPTRANES